MKSHSFFKDTTNAWLFGSFKRLWERGITARKKPTAYPIETYMDANLQAKTNVLVLYSMHYRYGENKGFLCVTEHSILL